MAKNRFHAAAVTEILLLIVLLVFCGLYIVSPTIKNGVNAAVDPAIRGMAVLYSQFSTVLHRKWGWDIGLVQKEIDPHFAFRVKVAQLVAENKAIALVDLASDFKQPFPRRTEALKALLKVTLNPQEEWVQPFLNRLANGAIPGATEAETPLIDTIFEKIYKEGELEKTLVRAYAEVVFSFLLQLNDAQTRSNAIRWSLIAMPETTLYLWIPRWEKEKDASVRRQFEKHIPRIPALADQTVAKQTLLPFFQNPPWRELKNPIGVMLARLGTPGMAVYLKRAGLPEEATAEEQEGYRKAMEGKPYPLKAARSSPRHSL